MKVGVVGCGAMGLPMARALLGAGADVRGLDVRPPAEFGDMAERMTTLPAAMADREVIFTIVRDAPQTDAILFGPRAFLPEARSLRTLVICSTLSPRYVRSLAERLPGRLALIDAPMSGAPIAAEERRLSFMLGGEQADIDAIWPLLAAMGEVFHRIGPFGAGMTAKVLNNLVAASSTAATRTALDWAQALGIDPVMLRAVLDDSSGQTWFGTKFDRIAWSRQGFAPGNTLGILVKDLEAMIDTAPEGADLTLPRALIETISRLDEID